MQSVRQLAELDLITVWTSMNAIIIHHIYISSPCLWSMKRENSDDRLRCDPSIPIEQLNVLQVMDRRFIVFISVSQSLSVSVFRHNPRRWDLGYVGTDDFFEWQGHTLFLPLDCGANLSNTHQPHSTAIQPWLMTFNDINALDSARFPIPTPSPPEPHPNPLNFRRALLIYWCLNFQYCLHLATTSQSVCSLLQHTSTIINML
jgi:hypothetical protein